MEVICSVVSACVAVLGFAYTVYRDIKKRGCEKRIVPKKERPRVYNELKVFLSVIINL